MRLLLWSSVIWIPVRTTQSCLVCCTRSCTRWVQGGSGEGAPGRASNETGAPSRGAVQACTEALTRPTGVSVRRLHHVYLGSAASISAAAWRIKSAAMKAPESCSCWE